MATLTRSRTTPEESEDIHNQHVLALADIPKPFPSLAEREQEEILESLAAEELRLDEHLHAAIPVQLVDTSLPVEDVQRTEELLPSIANVQASCIMTLNDLLSASSKWTPILPSDRRHSMPSPSSPSASSSVPTSLTHTSSSSALQTLVTNLRSQESGLNQMVQVANTLDEASLLRELQSRVSRISGTLNPEDALLANTLVSLIIRFTTLAELYPSPPLPGSPRVASWSANKAHSSHLIPSLTGTPIPLSTSTSGDALSNLRRQLSDFQLERSHFTDTSSATEPKSPVAAVETALLWTRIDEELETVLALCCERSSLTSVNLPPEYDPLDYDVEVDHLPQYEPGDYVSDAKSVRKVSEDAIEVRESERRRETSQSGGMSEKMRMDLERVTLAIDRLYMVAPQLSNQRVELKKAKVEQMEKARKNKTKGKDRDRDAKELERMLDMIGKASERKLVDQSVVMDGPGSMRERLERAKQKRAEFVTHILEQSGAGRMRSQDASLSQPSSPATFRSRSQPETSVHDDNALLTLPEFIRQPIPDVVQHRMDLSDPEKMLSLPDFIREPVPQHFVQRHSRVVSISHGGLEDDDDVSAPLNGFEKKGKTKSKRSRSLSAPPLAWLLSSSRSSSPSTPPVVQEKKRGKLRLSRPGSSSGSSTSLVNETNELDVVYVAEHHENLSHVVVFLTVLSGIRLGSGEIEAEVLPSSLRSQGFQLVLRCGKSSSPTLNLPVFVSSGKKQVSVVGGRHYEIKLSTVPSSSTPHHSTSPLSELGITKFSDLYDTPLLDATYLTDISPTSFICTSCSLPLVDASKLHNFRDLPSEHWAELVDAWMCHADQKLHEHIQKGSKDGFWPGEGDALVGGSYVIVREDTVVKGNVCEISDERHADDWIRIRCICGAVVGKCQMHKPSSSSPEGPMMVYRLAKYAFRPVSHIAEPLRVPLSAFIVEDMSEFVHAHATYRFVIVDEENDKPRILIWLFKPNMKLSYTTPSSYTFPKQALIRAAKVLFKLLGPDIGPSEMDGILNKYPGFPQAEHLYYPMNICGRLAALLKESNTAYPEGMKTMTGLDVGWLQRA
ncbi:HECT-like ubiquitin-conjugating enzyme-binding-domain-containing protein [Abortiporus biennis]|nr:HECT-like ubiquitin-conjugating enzyme-binding-domain-containing protein [Abortiporus biennis]